MEKRWPRQNEATRVTLQTLQKSIGPYRVLDVIGHGGMATVYKAYQPDLDRVVAIKVLLPAFSHDPGFRFRFGREARLVARLRHPHIVSVFGIGEDDDLPYLVMEYLEGQTLYALIRQRRNKGEVFAPDELLALLQPLANALDYAHYQGIVHRDLKPENIILTSHGPVITDFGLAKLVQEEAATVSVVMGTPSYMAPEQIRAEPVDGRTDIYALGILIYELLTGQAPFTGPTPFAVAQAHLNQPVPTLADLQPRLLAFPLLNEVARRAIAKRKVDRWPSAGALMDALTRAVGEPPGVPARTLIRNRLTSPADSGRITPHPVAPPPRLKRPVSSDSGGAGRFLGLIALIVVILVGIWGIGSLALQSGFFYTTAQSQVVAAPTRVSQATPKERTATLVAPTPSISVPGPVVGPSIRAVVRARAGAYLRSGPGVEYAVIGGLSDGAGIAVVRQANDWLQVVGDNNEQGWIAASLVNLTTDELASIPIADRTTLPTMIQTTSKPTPVVPGSRTVIRLEDTEWSGGFRNRGASIYGGRTATWVYGQGSGYSTMTAKFDLATAPAGASTLMIEGMDSEDSAKSLVRVLVNNVAIFEGHNPLPNDDMPLETGRWASWSLNIDAALIHPGVNTISIVNLSPGGVGLPPFVAIDYAVLQLP